VKNLTTTKIYLKKKRGGKINILPSEENLARVNILRAVGSFVRKRLSKSLISSLEKSGRIFEAIKKIPRRKKSGRVN